MTSPGPWHWRRSFFDIFGLKETVQSAMDCQEDTKQAHTFLSTLRIKVEQVRNIEKQLKRQTAEIHGLFFTRKTLIFIFSTSTMALVKRLG